MARSPIDKAKIKRAIEQEMIEIATDVLAEAKRQVPWEEGTLSRSATRETHWVGNLCLSTISFNTPYAAYQHENRNYTHPRPGAKAKYLEDPVREMYPKIRSRLAAAMDRAMR